MINFGKRRRTANVLKEVLLFQAGDGMAFNDCTYACTSFLLGGYDFAPIPSMQEKLKSESFDSEVIEEVEKWELSYFIEPRHGRYLGMNSKVVLSCLSCLILQTATG